MHNEGQETQLKIPYKNKIEMEMEERKWKMPLKNNKHLRVRKCKI